MRAVVFQLIHTADMCYLFNLKHETLNILSKVSVSLCKIIPVSLLRSDFTTLQLRLYQAYCFPN